MDRKTQANCPSWCVDDHANHVGGYPVFHRSAPCTVFDGLDGGEVSVSLESAVTDDPQFEGPFITIGSETCLTLEEARNLVDSLNHLLQQASPYADIYALFGREGKPIPSSGPIVHQTAKSS
ncbi:MAG: DUF6907 domain-containing protein [Nocardioidaceae bacterium]